jgi:hypothetical protein
MKLRVDLVKCLTEDDLLESAVESVHRYDPEPNFAKTGVGSLRPATPEEIKREMERSDALIKKLEARMAAAKANEAVRDG